MKTALGLSIPQSKLRLPAAGRDHVLGPVDAPLSIVEYGDYECPYCGEAYPVLKSIQRQMGVRLCFVFRNFPLSNMHPFAEHAAEAAEAAGAQGKFWEMHDLLFENQNSLDDASLEEFAALLGLDEGRVIREILSGEHQARVREDFRSGARSGVNGTPTLFINGRRHDGPPTVEALIEALEARTVR